MRYKPEHKEKTRRKIVETAAKEFRAQGVDGVGIAALMGGLRLTHGGFYAHFADKEALVAEALTLALDESLARMLAALNDGGIPALLDYYLSEGHRDNPAWGCPLPALAAEVARRVPASRDAFTEKVSEVFDAIAARIPGATDADKHAKVYFLFASMVGAVALARAVSDPVLSENLLRSTREHLGRVLQETAG